TYDSAIRLKRGRNAAGNFTVRRPPADVSGDRDYLPRSTAGFRSCGAPDNTGLPHVDAASAQRSANTPAIGPQRLARSLLPSRKGAAGNAGGQVRRRRLVDDAVMETGEDPDAGRHLVHRHGDIAEAPDRRSALVEARWLNETVARPPRHDFVYPRERSITEHP